MTAIRVSKFAAEMGWSNLEHVVAELRPSLRAEVSPTLTPLLEACPGMTEKIAKALVSHGVDSPVRFLQTPPLALAQMRQARRQHRDPVAAVEEEVK